MTATSLILKRLEFESNLAIHEFNIGANDAAVSARLRDLAREGKVIGHYRKGENFKRWSLVRKAEQMEFSEAV